MAICGSLFKQNILEFSPLLNCARFKPAVVKECIREVLKERLSGMLYEPDEVPELCRSLADSVKEKVKSK